MPNSAYPIETLSSNGSAFESLNLEIFLLISFIVASTHALSASVSNTINSSPAYRIAIPASGSDLKSIFPIVLIALSPILCPKLSLMCLKSFTSIIIPYKEFASVFFLFASTALRYLRLYNPESSSIYMFSAYDCICVNINVTAVKSHDDVTP